MVQGCSSQQGVQLDQEPWDIDFSLFQTADHPGYNNINWKNEARCGQRQGATRNSKRANNQNLSKLKSKTLLRRMFSWLGVWSRLLLAR